MRSLSTLEQLAGFDLTAKVFQAMASECDERGCYVGGAASPQEMRPTAPVRLSNTRAKSLMSGSDALAAKPIAFSRSAAIDIASDVHGNYVERRGLKPDDMSSQASLRPFFQYWRMLRAATSCKLSDLDPLHLMRAHIIGRLHIVDVGSSDPGDFRYVLAGYAIPLSPLERPSALPVTIYAEQVLRDYNTVRMTSAPRLERVRCRLSGVYYHYTRLILPFMDGRGRVSHLAVAIHREAGDGMKVEATAD